MPKAQKDTLDAAFALQWRLRNNGFLLLPSSDEPLSLFIHDFANALGVMCNCYQHTIYGADG